MKSATHSAQRPYPSEVRGDLIRDSIHKDAVQSGERLPPEREIAEMLDVTRTVVREAPSIMLEIQSGLVEVRREIAGIYVLDDNSGSQNTD
ncbi:GntR family transcriptional regulator [Escherichia coli]